MIIFIIIIHVLACLSLIAIVLFQMGKGAGLANIFGGGSSGLFTPSTGGFMVKFTAILAALFLMTSLYLSFSERVRRDPAIIQRILEEEENRGP